MAGLEIIVGTYEEYTLGFKVDNLKTDPSIKCLKQIFACHNHTSSVRSLATFENFLASGGADDRICLIDLKERSEFNQLMGHDGTVNSLAFSPDGKFLLSCGSDGKMIATNTSTWLTHKTWPKAHKGSVDYISIHPDGQLALTIGSDMNLKTWNMIDGRQVFVVNLKKHEIHGGSIFIVEWSPNGDNFALVGNKGVVILSMETTLPIKTIKTDVKPTSFCWIDDDYLAVGLDDGHFIYSNIQSNFEDKIQMEKCRIKAICSYKNHLVTATSAGDVSLWLLGEDTVDQVCTTNIGCRPICLMIVDAAKYNMEYEVKDEETAESQKDLKKIQSVGVVVVEDDGENEDEEKSEGNDEEDKVEEKKEEDKVEEKKEEDKVVEKVVEKTVEENVVDVSELQKNEENPTDVDTEKDQEADPKAKIMETSPSSRKEKKNKKTDKKANRFEDEKTDNRTKKSKKQTGFIEEDLNEDDKNIMSTPKTDKKSTKRKAMNVSGFLEEDFDDEEAPMSAIKKNKMQEKTQKKKKIASKMEDEEDDFLVSKSFVEKSAKKSKKHKSKANKTVV